MRTYRTENKVEIEQIKFVANALSKLVLNPVYTALYYNAETQWLIGTDSRRLHIVVFPMDIETGFYKMIKDGKAIMLIDANIDAQFPNYKQIIPSEFSTVKTFVMPMDKTIAISKLTAVINKNLDENACINIDFVKDATIPTANVIVSNNKGLSPVMIEYKGKSAKAIIMPLQLKLED